MEIRDHWLTGEGVGRLKCTKCNQVLEITDTLVLHATDGSNAMSSAQYLARKDTSVSAHLVISRTGNVIQILPFNIRGWHAGVSKWQERVGLNNYSIGIELANAGRLHRRKGRFFTWFNQEVMPDQVYCRVEQGHAEYWQRFPREQVDCLVEVCQLLVSRYLIKYVLRHSDITDRKVDPGPAFPFEEVCQRLGIKNG